MYLKKYQQKVVDVIRDFLDTSKQEFDKAVQVKEQVKYNWVQESFKTKNLNLVDNPENGLGWYYPRVTLKVPTGGGKTILAVEAIREFQQRFAQKRTGLVVWIVPSEIIYTQTISRLRNRTNPLRQLLDQSSGGRTIILEKGQRLNCQDIEENLVVLFVMIQSISRKNGKEGLKVFRDSGGYEGFFPADNRTDLHARLIDNFPNLDLLSDIDGLIAPLIRTSLGNAVRVSNPLIIIDEIHKVNSDQARETINGLNPAMVLGLSATPKENMNLLVSISGLELKEEDMIKLDLHIIPPHSSQSDDWKAMLRELKKHREKLELKAKKLLKEQGLYLRPIALIQVEATGNDQRGKGRVHSLDAKDYLVESGVNPDQIAIKTSSQNDIENLDLLSSSCDVRYIITKQALQEGWDCPFAYLLGIIPNANSDSGVTQLIGRILRQPNARKTGIKELDESYVYFTKGDTRPLLEKVSQGFQKEGMEDLVSRIAIDSIGKKSRTKIAKIRDAFKKHEYAFYLPVWVMVNGKTGKRKFNWHTDINSALDFSQIKITKELITQIQKSLSTQNIERTTFAVTISEESKTKTYTEGTIHNGHDQISNEYITRRYIELIPNAFSARSLCEQHLLVLSKKLGKESLRDHFGFIVSTLVKHLESEKLRQEESIFLDLIKNKKLVLAVSTDTEFGWSIPTKDEIQVSGIDNPYKYYLFDDVDINSMNSLEQNVGDILEKQDRILWWFRNKVGRDWYSIQGWRKNKISPDFVAAKRDGDKVEVVYILESKGEHLMGNTDTLYKKNILDLITSVNREKKIQTFLQQELPFGNLNQSIEAHLVEQGKEETDIRKLF